MISVDAFDGGDYCKRREERGSDEPLEKARLVIVEKELRA